ncbi:L,D-transpeptidase family protein [Biformimicrobium ophioploci]|uniref:L,D-TPase catalytic domain-containing protein n=1 Tax=Biformimicrobium ophioploci TaxID=3036711 RepID=A0ABQ6LUR2_9GAMM|nr:L,D-transpeptidase family protein [Microbulbifer sp. NKW57]GMG85826.1 hypothetical protein MNKW57_01470 [Microbulbifer sp. NKW57]
MNAKVCRTALASFAMALCLAPAAVIAKTSITIDLSEQQAYLYNSGKLVKTTRVSTGKSGFRTPTGSFRVSQKNVDHRSNIYGDYVSRSSGKIVRKDVDVRKDKRPPGTYFRGAPMRYFLRINGGIGMHAGYVPNYPASHGCIRLPKANAALFYQYAKIGTRVVVRH